VTTPIARLRALVELAGKATGGQWTNEEFYGQCILKHQHGQGVCDYRVKSCGLGTNILSAPMVVGASWNEAQSEALIVAGQWDYDSGGIRKVEDAAFIAAARNAIPDLEAVIEENKKLTQIIERFYPQRNAFMDEIEAQSSALVTLRVENERLVAEARTLRNVASLVAEEREACARIADDVAVSANDDGAYGQETGWPSETTSSLFKVEVAAAKIATRIRARAALATPTEEGKK